MTYKTKIVETGTKEILKAYDLINKTYQSINTAKDNFIGNALSDFKNEKTAEAIKALEQAKQNISNELDEYKKTLIDEPFEKALNAETMTKDYAVLSLPVLLTGDELQVLCEKNKDDVLFIRACNEYALKHNIVFTFKSIIEDRKAIYEECVEFWNQFTEDKIATSFERFESQNSYFYNYLSYDGFEKMDDKIHATLN
jgi:hypothetical protein